MQIITDPKEITKAISFMEFSSHFKTDDLQFEIRKYDKNEQISSPLRPLSGFLFILSGIIRVYHIDDDSILHSVINIGAKEVMGYNEFAFRDGNHSLYSEAITNVKVLVLPFRQHTHSLYNDSQFLMYLLKSNLSLQIQHTEMNRFHDDLADKLLFYIENICANKTLDNVNTAVLAMGCSRRQLQRVLKKLCDCKILSHEKRGCYVLKQ